MQFESADDVVQDTKTRDRLNATYYGDWQHGAINDAYALVLIAHRWYTLVLRRKSPVCLALAEASDFSDCFRQFASICI